MLPTKFQLIWLNGFRENLFKLVNHKQELLMATRLVVWSARNMEILYMISHTSFLQSNNSLHLLVSEENFYFLFQSIRNKNCPWRSCFCPIGMKLAVFIEDLHRCFLARFGSFGQAVSEFFFFYRNWPTRNKNCISWPCLLPDRNDMIIIYRWHSIDPFYQVLVHLAKLFQMGKFLEIDQPETRINYDCYIC
jgi:hypothetical protein